jgi:hypothetical protein
MRVNIWYRCVVVSLLLTSGCGWFGGSKKVAAKPAPADKQKVAADPQKPAAETKDASKSEPAANATDTAAAEPAEPKKAPKRAVGLSSLFRAPEIPQELLAIEKPAEAKTEAKAKAAQPKIRLLGFAKMDGETKALLDTGKDVVTAVPGDVLDGVEVISIENEEVTFQYAKARWTTQLFQQDWLNEQTGSSTSRAFAGSTPTRGATNNKSRTVSSASPTRTTKPIFQNNRPNSTNTQNTAAAATATGGNIPGIPGISGGASSIPGMPTASSPNAAAPSSPAGAPAMPTGLPGGMGGPAMPGGAPAAPGGAPTVPGGGGLPGGLPGGGLPGGAPGGAVPGGGGLPGLP